MALTKFFSASEFGEMVSWSLYDHSPRDSDDGMVGEAMVVTFYMHSTQVMTVITGQPHKVNDHNRACHWG